MGVSVLLIKNAFLEFVELINVFQAAPLMTMVPIQMDASAMQTINVNQLTV